MATVKINNKTYQVPELTFRHSRMFEQMGLPLTGLNSPGYFFTAVAAFIAVCVNCSVEQAEYLADQHVNGGGDLQDIYTAYVNAIGDSGFFKKLLKESKETPKTTKKSAQQKTE